MPTGTSASTFRAISTIRRKATGSCSRRSRSNCSDRGSVAGVDGQPRPEGRVGKIARARLSTWTRRRYAILPTLRDLLPALASAGEPPRLLGGAEQRLRLVDAFLLL